MLDREFKPTDDDQELKKLTEELCFGEAILLIHLCRLSDDEEIKRRIREELSRHDEKAREMFLSLFPDIDPSTVPVIRSEDYVDLDDIVSRARKYLESLEREEI